MGSPPKVKPPPIPSPQATPSTASDSSLAADEAIKKQRRKSGFEKTLLTGTLGATGTGKTTLGG
jgi:hypothetical protein